MSKHVMREIVFPLLRTGWILLVIIGLYVTRGHGQEQSEAVDLDAAKRAEIIDSVSAALNEIYVFPDVAKEMESHLRQRNREGAYDLLSTLPDFTQMLTRDLRSVSHDLHLGVSYVSPEMVARMTSDTDSEELERERREALARDNYRFRKVEILPGNVGYLRFDAFIDASLAGPTAIAALNFLSNVDALIIDLRYNGGGSPSLIQLITSYFFEEPVHLNSFYIRKSDETTQFWTQSHVEGPRLTDVDMYVLTSDRTFSGAEEFSYNLRNLERATLVGDTTGGGAHPTERHLFANLNVGMSLPFGRAVNPITDTNWEGVGVIPHVAVPPAEALERAHILALEKLKEEAPDEGRASTLSWAIDGIKARLNPVKVSSEVLQSYVGSYGPRTLTLEAGVLYYQREGNPRMQAIPMTERLFRFAEIDYFRIEVVLDEAGQPVKLVGHYDNGTTDESPRTPSG
ncbi:MAG: S41 family peptidase [Gemmatimonadota bacterium]|nr:MAG: S41 family peptidase [Gemmatimonadota bacterium]